MKRLGEVATLKARIGWQGLTTAEYLNSGDFILVTGTELADGDIIWSQCHYVDEVDTSKIKIFSYASATFS